MNEDRIINFLRAYKGAIIGGLIAIVFWIIASILGFWNAIFFIIFVLVCAFIGQKLFKNGLSGILRFLDKLFKN